MYMYIYIYTKYICVYIYIYIYIDIDMCEAVSDVLEQAAEDTPSPPIKRFPIKSP